MMDSLEIKYQQCMNYIFEKLPMFTRVGAVAYKPNLDNIISSLTLVIKLPKALITLAFAL
jgi:hypothetical protein